MKLLLDTHSFLFAIGGPQNLGEQGRALLSDHSVPRWVSPISLWEIAIKVQLGKLTSSDDPRFYTRHLRKLRADILPVSLRHSLAILRLPLHHRDPFDRLLIAQAIEEDLTLLTRDHAFAKYEVKTVW